MGFFNKFGTVNYSLDGYNKDAMNIITAAIVKRLRVDESYVHMRYTISDGEIPEGVANELYKDPQLYWTILLVNAIVNPFLEWPVSTDVLEDIVKAKYGNVNKIIAWQNNTTGLYYDDVDSAKWQAMVDNGQQLPMAVHPVTALAWENDLNTKRAQIVVVDPKYINLFVDMFNKVVEGTQ
ncbi:baseplate wedge protein [Stenotrophomonas phage Moby]|uniref:Baseplate wedge protein n=1 Tax=Stenotrophomonas phage Moby TaxID=2601680 RepID=A0A5P8PMQ9_9CAUD|nr:baseplate wedge protein [Stenotrophomonas phage Moby]QFR57944.1 baseplate wedge protein [Stenotrophomonas phage Moby]